MSATQSQSTLESKLQALQCHFTWDLDPSRSKLLCVRDNLEDIGTQEGYSWLGYIYNLQGFIHCRLGFLKDARCFFCRATEAFRQIRNTVSDEGQWLVVSYGNLAWLHHHLGEQAQSQGYISKVDALINEYASPSPDELHPEIYAEKAWTLMKFGKDNNLLAADYFQRAIRMQPGMVEWQTSHVIALVNSCNHQNKNLGADIMEKVKLTKEQDQANLYLAALYLEACADKGINIEYEARELARRVLRKAVSSYSGIEPLLRLYRRYLSMDEAVDLAEEALERHPDERYLKRCAATCYKWRILSQKDNPLEHSMINRAISLCKEVIFLYPHSSFKMQITLANIYAQSNTTQAAADQIYEELLQSDLDPEEAQRLYNYYAKYLHFNRKEIHKSIEFHMKAAAIPQQSPYRDNSIRYLEKIREKNRNRMCGEIQEFLDKLQQ
ncbi:interferon-induced protein with tetratricopeptide repeats 1B-like [Stegastes partitus]|uniref:Interferon-induced protein with tetratricopeptide repeats 1B-like n=1 Tax=Stegastes partitus TaxID=144197 RepID=A0A9Y4MYA5_9TELE|nr:PREDICTED: interferon-induced protein with tetratricopeptide repeats 1B-like [Stegastes partitus]